MQKYDYVIYKHTNEHNNKSYIGKTIRTMESRWNAHVRGSEDPSPTSIFHRSIKKYGIDCWKHEVLEEGVGDNNLIAKQEMYWISKYDTFVNGYNMTKGGEGLCGYTQTDKQKEIVRKMRTITNIFDFKKLKPYEDKLSVSFKNDLNIFFKNELQGKCTETTKTHLERLFIYETDESVIIDKVKAFMLLTNGQKVSTSLEVMQLRWGDAEGERRYKDKCEKDYVNHNKMKQQRLDKFNGKYVTPKMVEWYTDKGYSVEEAEEKIQKISDKQSETIKETLRKKAKSVQI